MSETPKSLQDLLDEQKAQSKIHKLSERQINSTIANRLNRDRNSEANRGRAKTREQIEKRRASMPDQSGENNPFYGKSHKTETKDKISAKKKGCVAPNKGATHTDEALQKMRKPRSEEGKTNMRKPRSKMLTCPHCDKTGASGNMSRYHMDNCKSRP